MDEADGVLLIYNPDAPSQDQQLGDWFEYFVRRNGLKDEQCMVSQLMYVIVLKNILILW